MLQKTSDPVKFFEVAYTVLGPAPPQLIELSPAQVEVQVDVVPYFPYEFPQKHFSLLNILNISYILYI